MSDIKPVLTIAGSDTIGGAGIQADLKTFLANKVYGMSVISALTAQNTEGISGILKVPNTFFDLQLEAVLSDIIPSGTKIGMLLNTDNINIVCDKIKKYKLKNVVLDPLMISTSGTMLIEENAIDLIINKLSPMADLITPNINEAQYILKEKIENFRDMETSALNLEKKLKTNILLKGGHIDKEANDVLCINQKITWIKAKRLKNKNIHGTGCTLSSAVVANLAKGYDMENSVRNAKEYLYKAIEFGLDLGKGVGPLYHGCIL